MLDISLVIPLLNEEESLPDLVAWIERVMKEHQYRYEILMIDDGSKDQSWAVIADLHQKNKSVKGIKFQRNYGKSAALHTGFAKAEGAVVITMDADLQDSPDEIPELYRMIREDGYDLVSGWKKKRYDPITKTIPTKLYNWTVRKISGLKLHDTNCGLKAYKKVVIKNIEVYGEMHRYIPVIAKWSGFENIGEKVVQHRARQFGTTKFGMERFVNGFLDLLSITFVGRFGKRPMHFFGALGMIMFMLGFFVFIYLGGTKVYSLIQDIPAKNIADISWFYIALTTMILGTQLFLAGFLAELISRNAPHRNRYLVETILE